MHETLDPIDRLFIGRTLREPNPFRTPSPAVGAARPSTFRRLRARIGHQLIRIGSAIAAEPSEVVHHRRRRVPAA